MIKKKTKKCIGFLIIISILLIPVVVADIQVGSGSQDDGVKLTPPLPAESTKGVGGDIDFANIALTNVSEVWDDGLDISLGGGGFFNGLFNWIIKPISSIYLNFNGSTLTFDETQLNNTVFDITKSKSYNATNINTLSGTLDWGNISSIWVPEDFYYYNVSEDVGADPLIININFTGVISFDSIIGRIFYSGGQGHEMQLEIQRSDNLDWENYYEETDTTDFINIYVPVFDPQNHVFSNGDVAVRFFHFQTGIPSHDFFIDYLALVDGFTALTVADHDALGGRNVITNHPWALDTNATRNMTGNLEFSNGNNLSIGEGGWFKGWFNWIIGAGSEYINFNGTTLNLTTNATKWFYNMSDGSYNATYDTLNSSKWNVSGNNLFPQSLEYKVGIGTANPFQKVQLSSTSDDVAILFNEQDLMGGSCSGTATACINFQQAPCGSIGTPQYGCYWFTFCIGTPTICTAFNSSTSCEEQGGCSWNPFGIDVNRNWTIGIKNQTGDFYISNSNNFLSNNFLTILNGSGNIGIGIVNPKYHLEIANSANSLNVSGFFYVNSTSVGIGTTNPESYLSVIESGIIGTPALTINTIAYFKDVNNNANIGIITGSGKSSSFLFGDTDSQDVGSISYSHADNTFQWNVLGGSTEMFLNVDGLSIGRPVDNTPDAWLDIEPANNNDVAVNIQSHLTQSVDILQVVNKSNSPLFIIDSDGDVGIGTSTPRTSLDVNGVTLATTLRIEKYVALPAGEGLELGYSTNAYVTGYNRSSSKYLPLAFRGSTLSLRINNTEKMIINENGNIGIGTSTPNENLVIGDDLGSFAGTRISIGGDAFTGIGFGYNATDRLYFLTTTGGDFAKIGTVQKGVTYDNAISINGSRIGIGGVSSSNASEVLKVYGWTTGTGFVSTSDRDAKLDITLINVSDKFLTTAGAYRYKANLSQPIYETIETNKIENVCDEDITGDIFCYNKTVTTYDTKLVGYTNEESGYIIGMMADEVAPDCNRNGVDLYCMITLTYQKVIELIKKDEQHDIKLNLIEQENLLLESKISNLETELCKKDNTYSFCIGGVEL